MEDQDSGTKALLGSMNASLIDDLLLTADRKWSLRCKISGDKLIQQLPEITISSPN